MRCISFLGSVKPDKRRVCRADLCIETDLVQEAIYHLYHPDEIILCISDPASAGIAASLTARSVPVRIVWIPSGTDEDQLWTIFSLICSEVSPGEEILFDITNGCHSLPFLAFLIASYLKTVSQVTVTGVIYLPAPDDHGFSRFVNLLPLMSVLDWIAGVRALTTYTDARPLRLLLSGLQAGLHRTQTIPDPPTRLSGWAHLLENFCHAVRLSRPIDALYAAEGIVSGLPEVSGELDRVAPSLVPILSSIDPLRPLASPPPDRECSIPYLRSQLALIRYQVTSGLYFQAVSLSREVLVSGVMILTGHAGEWLDADLRHEISRTLTGSALARQGKLFETTPHSHKVTSLAGWEEMVTIWIRVSDLRNDLAHCGMNLREERVQSLLKRAARIPEETCAFLDYCSETVPGTDAGMNGSA